MDKQLQIKELSLEICQYLIPEAYQKDIPPKTRAEDIALHLLNCGYVKARKGNIYEGYAGAINQCAKTLNEVDREYHTYGEIEIDNISVTKIGDVMPQYVRKMECRRILVQ